jgi:hypothetical protein
VSLCDRAFPYLSASTRLSIQSDQLSEYSVSDAESADALSSCMRALLDASHMHARPDAGVAVSASAYAVTDACSCIGGNTLSFARFFSEVNAVERSPVRFAMLKNNCAVSNSNSQPSKHSSASAVLSVPSLTVLDCVLLRSCQM